MEGVGRTCPGPAGLLEVLGPDGRSLGFTHGPDPAPSETDGSGTLESADPLEPTCVDPADARRYTQVIYARAHDDADNHAALVDEIRDQVREGNGIYADAAAASGQPGMRLRIACQDGEIDVPNEVLPTDKDEATFSTIKSDLLDAGYDDPKTKYLVFYDDPEACGCAGLGQIYDDDRPGAENWNNGNGNTPLYGVNYGETGTWGTEVTLHELSHTLGAVQHSAPHSTGGFHCTDGKDIMCYNDGGEDGDQYDETNCPDQTHYDCGADDYCNATPAAESYLATHWNLCGANITYVDDGAPVMETLACQDPVEVDTPLSCDVMATSEATGIAYTLTWSPEVVEREPADGYVDPGVARTVDHTYTTAGFHTVAANATDDTTNHRTSRTIETTVHVMGPPTIEALSCDEQVVRGDRFACSFTATDPESPELAYHVDWGDGSSDRVPASGFAPEGEQRSAEHAIEEPGTYTVTVTAEDPDGLASDPVEATVEVTLEQTPPTLDVEHPAPGVLYRGCEDQVHYAPSTIEALAPAVVDGTGCAIVHVSDAGTGVASVTLSVDGQLVATKTDPDTGTTASGTYRFTFETDGADEDVPVRIEAVDAAGNTASRTVHVLTL